MHQCTHRRKRSATAASSELPLVGLVGQPNVGKSALFSALSGHFAVVSNYPGTTVEILRGATQLGPGKCELIDTPGVRSLIPGSEEERITRNMLIEEPFRAVVHVADSKNLERELCLLSELSDVGVPVVLALNMWDEAGARGISIDVGVLAELTGVPVVCTVATEGTGVGSLIQVMEDARPARLRVDFGPAIEGAIESISRLLPKAQVGKRMVSLALLAGDEALEVRLSAEARGEVRLVREKIQAEFAQPISFVIGKRRAACARDLASRVFSRSSSPSVSRARNIFAFWLVVPAVTFFVGYLVASVIAGAIPETASAIWFTFRSFRVAVGGFVSLVLSARLWLTSPKAGITTSDFLSRLSTRLGFAVPLMIFALWLVYTLVGQLGAGTLVDLLENRVFGSTTSPPGMNYYLARWGARLFAPGTFVYDLLLGEDAGLVTVGVRYSLAVVLPVVTIFFLLFGLMEDSGYLPRLALVLNRQFQRMGLSGKAVLPMVLGLGCDTMATLSTRVLDTKKERTITTLLLALAVPCSAQLGVIAGMLGRISAGAFVLYVLVIVSQLFVVGALAARVIPGERAHFLLEIPPLRVPKVKNVLAKTLHRVRWFLTEAVPLFLLGTSIMFILMRSRLLGILERVSSPIVSGLLGLPSTAAKGFILGFLRRDYGAVVMFEDFRAGGGTPHQVLVSLVVITLFIPCVANLLVMIKEQGWRAAAAMVSFIIPYAILVGTVLRVALIVVHVELARGP